MNVWIEVIIWMLTMMQQFLARLLSYSMTFKCWVSTAVILVLDMTPCESFLLAKNGSLKLKQLELITFLMLEYRYKWSEMMHNTHSAQISQKQDGWNIFAIMKSMCPPRYHHNGFVATHALGHIVYGGQIVLIIAYILCPSCFCEIWALCESWITSDHLYIMLLA